MTSELQVFMLPDLGEGLTEAELVNWLVSVGDEIRVDQPIAEVETAKSMVEVPSPYAGTVTVLHGEPGQTLDVGKPLISVAPAGSVVELASVVEPVETYREEEKAGAGNVLIGYRTPGEPRLPGQWFSTISTNDLVVEPDAQKVADDVLLLRTRVPGKSDIVIFAARQAHGPGTLDDLGDIHGSGDSRLIMRRDVEAVISTPVVEPVETRGSRQARSPEAVPGTDTRTGLDIFCGARQGCPKALGANTSRSRAEISEATVWVDVDATALVALRAGLTKSDLHNTPGLLAFIARFVTSGLTRFPDLNTRIETAADGTQEIVGFARINLRFEAQTDHGLLVHSIRNADKLSARELDAEIRRLTTGVCED